MESAAAVSQDPSSGIIQFIPDLNIDYIEESPSNPRTHFDEAKLSELALSIGEKGVLEPVLVRPHPDGTGYQLVFGHRRLRAARMTGHLHIPAMVRDMSDEEALELQVEENHKRSDLHPLEEGAGFKALLGFGQNVERIADRLSVSTKFVYDRIKLLELIGAGQKLFLDGAITPGHAILLSRLEPKRQAELIGDEKHPGPLFIGQQLLWDPRDDEPDNPDKPISVRELAAWIDKHVRFDPGDVDPILFPETATALVEATSAGEKIILISFEHMLHPEAKAPGPRVYCATSWREATGRDKKSKTCERSVTGVIVAGAARGETLRVCTDKKGCAVHWAYEQKQAKQRASGSKAGAGQDYEKHEAARRAQAARGEAERERWKKARPAMIDAFKERIGSLALKPRGPVYTLAGEMVYDLETRKSLVGAASPEEFVRALALWQIARANEWNIADAFPRLGKLFGVDVKKILDQAAPEPKAEKPEPKKKAGKAGKKK